MIEFSLSLVYNTPVGRFSPFVNSIYEVKKVALSQDFEARRRERLKMQHKKRERQRKIQRIVLIVAIAFLAFLLIFNIVKCAKQPSEDNNTPIVTEIPDKKDEEAKFDPSMPEPKEGRNNYLDIIKDSGQTDHVYLTFDNGPSEDVTPAILDVLRRYNVKATFFMNGTDIKDNPYLCTRAIEEGHLVLPLSKSGNADILYADKTTFMDEVEETYDLIVENTPDGKKPIKLYRFLGGSYENSAFGSEKQRYKDELAENGYYYCDWNAGIGDSNTARSAEQLMTYYKNNEPDLNNLVIQLNNKEENTATPKMLGNLIEYLMEKGYTFSRLDEIEFINEIEYEDEEATFEDEEGNADTDEDEDSESPTKKPTSTKKPSSATASPKATKKPSATTAPAATKKPTQRPATITPAPQTVTLPPASGNEIEAE